jgi:hypothetical protein
MARMAGLSLARSYTVSPASFLWPNRENCYLITIISNITEMRDGSLSKRDGLLR